MTGRLLPSPGMSKRQPEPEPRGRGRPPLNASGAPPHTLTLRMSEETRDAAAGYAEAHGDPETGKALPLAEAFRELATAWSESEAVRKAVAAWRRAHRG